MKRSDDPGEDRESRGGFGPMKVRGDEEALAPLLGREFKNLTPTSSRYSRSKRENVSRTSIDFTIGRLSAGQAVTELDVYEHSFSRYRRADSLIVLREVRRRYPKNTTLEIKNGLYTLIPVPGRSA